MLLFCKILNNFNRFNRQFSNRMWFSVGCTLVDNENASSQCSKFVVDSLGCAS